MFLKKSMFYEENKNLDSLEESSGVIPSNWASKLSGLFKKN